MRAVAALWALVLSLAVVAAAPGSPTGISEVVEITALGRLGGLSNISCKFVPTDIDIKWKFDGLPLLINDTRFKNESAIVRDENLVSIRRVSLLIPSTKLSDHGLYSCFISGDVEMEKEIFLNLTLPTKLVQKSESPIRVKNSETAIFNCIFEGFNLTEVKWRKSHNFSQKFPVENTNSIKINETHINGTLKLIDVNRKDNGSYFCGARDPLTNNVIVAHIDLLVLDKPQVSLDFIKAVGAKKIYLNWTINDGNAPIESYGLQYRKNGTDTWTYYSTPIGGNNVSFVMTGLDPSTSYQLKIDAKNSQGRGKLYTDSRWIKTLTEDPHFIPDIMVKGFSLSSVTIGWHPPPANLSEYVHYYELMAKEIDSPDGTEKEAIHSGNLPYMFDDLMPDTIYIFKVRSCSELTKECGQWSVPVNISTLDGLSGPPKIDSFFCQNDNISGTNFVMVSWKPPDVPNGKIIRYDVEIVGNASFVNSEGVLDSINWGPKIRHVAGGTLGARFDTMPANTNFTVKVSAVTRIKRPGEVAFVQCMTPPSIPPRDSLQGIKWVKVRESNGRWMFKLYIPRVTERNGAICCYRIFIVRMKNQQKLSDMPSPEHLTVSSYKNVHNGKQGNGAYIAEIFTSNTLETDVILGDGVTFSSEHVELRNQCGRCASVLFQRTNAITSTLPPIITPIPPNIVIPNESPDKANLQKENSIKDVEIGTKSGVTAIPVDISTSGELVNSSTEILEAEKKHSKKKRKLQKSDPTHETKPDVRNLLLNNLQDYQNTQPRKYDNLNAPRDTYSSLNDEQPYVLDNDFYMKRRIYHQNKVNPYRYGDDSNVADMDAVKEEDNLELDEDDTVIPEMDDESADDLAFEMYGNKVMNDANQNAKFVRGHKIVARQVSQDKEFGSDGLSHRSEKSLHDLSSINSNQAGNILSDRIKKSDDSKVLLPKPLEEVVDINMINEKKTETDESTIFDGELDNESNYTGFIELIVHSDQSEKMMPMYSDYFSVLKPGPTTSNSSENVMEFDIYLKVLVGCIVVAFVMAIILCALHEHSRRKARNHGVEMHTLQTTLRNLYQGLTGGRHQLVPHSPPDMPPISKEDLLSAYNERQVDSGYGFQQEFELLPDCFPDRTMDASEAKENQGKNRYPDIKAYDQTRVKLAQIDSIVGSDYINANIVMGYKERKKFICAQGPTDITVDDFWRMIWEYNLELVVMLTNLEEYSKVKCSKYWPDQNHSDKMFNNISVRHLSEKRYSDYIIRELKISKNPLTNSNSNNQIIEANGVAKKNGVTDCNNGHTSGASDERIVHQYHFLMWKDFVAPEYPHAILKFIKRMNEASPAGRPVLVHCSAGVGRTGTLVALDCLLQQLGAENQAAVFNTVCDLRRQRNFLVQSLKQYIFVYRALVEYAQYDDTEIFASQLKSTVDRLRQTAENCDTCTMEEEFEKIKQPILEVVKPCTAGRSPEHIAKNRSEAVVPYDHNRVILVPIPTKENSTFINASFIEGYDNSESYIIAQDPLPSTIADFWRMVSEQEISTIVMLSELGEGKCPRYWDDDEIQYEHINVTYLLSESCPYYTRREFQVTNTKNQDRIRVTQFQYHGWPTVSGQVPEVTRGLIELVGQCGVSSTPSPPILVHCSLGTDRSSMFVALSILTIQLRTECRVDVSTVTRKLRSQRMGCLDTFLQYEFLHRAIVNYAELHNLLSDS